MCSAMTGTLSKKGSGRCSGIREQTHPTYLTCQDPCVHCLADIWLPISLSKRDGHLGHAVCA